MAELGMAVAAVIDKEANQRADGIYVRAVDDRASVTRASHQSRTRKNAEVRREGIVRTTNFFRDDARSKTIGFCGRQKLEDCEPSGLS
jgi:hypothetical protein